MTDCSRISGYFGQASRFVQRLLFGRGEHVRRAVQVLALFLATLGPGLDLSSAVYSDIAVDLGVVEGVSVIQRFLFGYLLLLLLIERTALSVFAE